mmetsp:Transcript_31942/g.85302  ORF Transcript_31942/g.85302 Transcript_31942/m.85302 type:complete len:82 (+) Transcript_31942:376-621(+)
MSPPLVRCQEDATGWRRPRSGEEMAPGADADVLVTADSLGEVRLSVDLVPGSTFVLGLLGSESRSGAADHSSVGMNIAPVA